MWHQIFGRDYVEFPRCYSICINIKSSICVVKSIFILLSIIIKKDYVVEEKWLNLAFLAPISRRHHDSRGWNIRVVTWKGMYQTRKLSK